jgi:aromatic amino acid aminotransferase I
MIQEFVERVYKPGYANWKILVHTGNTDGWVKAVMTLCDPGDTIVTTEWTYPSALAAAKPLGIKIISVPLDGEGMRSDALFELLATLDESVRGAPRYVLRFSHIILLHNSISLLGLVYCMTSRLVRTRQVL